MKTLVEQFLFLESLAIPGHAAWALLSVAPLNRLERKDITRTATTAHVQVLLLTWRRHCATHAPASRCLYL